MGEILRLLIVEDDTYICSKFENILENEKEVKLLSITNNSNEAVSLIKDNRKVQE